MVRYRYRILSYSFLGIDTNGMSFILDFYQLSYHVFIINPILVVLETIFWSGCLLYTNHQKLKTCQTEGTGFSQGCTPRWSNRPFFHAQSNINILINDHENLIYLLAFQKLYTYLFNLFWRCWICWLLKNQIKRRKYGQQLQLFTGNKLSSTQGFN